MAAPAPAAAQRPGLVGSARGPGPARPGACGAPQRARVTQLPSTAIYCHLLLPWQPAWSLPGCLGLACVMREQLQWPATGKAASEPSSALHQVQYGWRLLWNTPHAVHPGHYSTGALEASPSHLMLTCALSRPAACSACARLTSRAAFFSMRYAWAGAGVNVEWVMMEVSIAAPRLREHSRCRCRCRQ